MVFEAKRVDKILRRLYLRNGWLTESEGTLTMKEVLEKEEKQERFRGAHADMAGQPRENYAVKPGRWTI